MNYKKHLEGALLLPLLLFVLLIHEGCGGPGPAAPTRKKMPELTSLEGPESYIPYGERQSIGGLFLNTGYVDLQVSGGFRTMFVVSLPYAGDDSLILNLVEMYRPLAVPLLSNWVQQQKHPVLIDLREPGSRNVSRAEYLVQRQGAFSLPVVFLWDSHSAGRASNYMELLNTTPAISVTRLSDSNLSGNKAFGNCF